jgi:hypothetical protein
LHQPQPKNRNQNQCETLHPEPKPAKADGTAEGGGDDEDEDEEEATGGFRITMTFEENPYFTNEVRLHGMHAACCVFCFCMRSADRICLVARPQA